MQSLQKNKQHTILVIGCPHTYPLTTVYWYKLINYKLFSQTWFGIEEIGILPFRSLVDSSKKHPLDECWWDLRVVFGVTLASTLATAAGTDCQKELADSTHGSSVRLIYGSFHHFACVCKPVNSTLVSCVRCLVNGSFWNSHLDLSNVTTCRSSEVLSPWLVDLTLQKATSCFWI